MQHHIDMTGLTFKPFVMNSRNASASYQASIQNNTAQSLTVTVTNKNILAGVTGEFKAPAAGALVIASGDNGYLDEPYVGALMTLGGAGVAGDTIDIVEAG